MSQVKIDAEPRDEFGKGAARRIRRAHKVPAVLYGHGTDPVHITLPGHDTMLALKHAGANAVLAINLDGKEQLALTKQVQRHPVRGELEHVDLLIVRRGEKVVVDVPVVVVGEAAAETLVTTEHPTISLQAEATHIPESVEVSVEGAEAGFQVFAQDLDLPADTTLEVPGDTLVVHVSDAPVIELEEPETDEEQAAEGEAADEAATEDEGSADESAGE